MRGVGSCCLERGLLATLCLAVLGLGLGIWLEPDMGLSINRGLNTL